MIMSGKKRIIVCLCVCLLMTLLCGCDNNGLSDGNNVDKAETEGVKVTYKDIIYNKVTVNKSTGDIRSESPYIRILRTLDEYRDAVETFHFNDEIIYLYDEEYFKNNDLILILIYSTPGHTYNLIDIINFYNKLIIKFDDLCPKIDVLAGVFKGVLIDVDKNQLNDINKTELNINTIYAD